MNRTTFLTRLEMQMDGWFGLDKPYQVSDEETFLGVARDCLKFSGISIPTDSRQLIVRALTSTDYPKLLADVSTKLLQKSFDAQARTYQYWLEPWLAKDFKSIEIPRIGWPDELPELNPDGGEYSYLSLTEGGESASISVFGGLIRFSRRLLIDDDRSGLAQRVKAAGQLAARTLSRRAYYTLENPGNLSDGSPFFGTARGNLLEGTSEKTLALDADSLGLAIAALRTQKDDSGNFLDFEPKFLIVPPSLELTAWSLCNSGSLLGQENSGIANLFKDRYGLLPIIAPELTSDKDWYLFTRPDIGCFKMLSFFDGWPKPYIEQQLQWRSDNLELKTRVDFEVCPVNPKGCVKVSVYSG